MSCKKVDKINWPKSPKSIFTSNSIYGDELFKHYAGIKNSSRLIVGQHGGGYGISKLSFPEYHELSIADKFVLGAGLTKLQILKFIL